VCGGGAAEGGGDQKVGSAVVAEEEVEGRGAGWYMACTEGDVVMVVMMMVMWIDFLQSACDLHTRGIP
jgi:hypothetical protein